MRLKECKKCKHIKDLREYYKHKRSNDGYQAECKKCHNIAIYEYRKLNREKYSLYQSNYKIKKQTELKEKRNQKRQQLNAYTKHKYNKDTNFKISCLLRGRLNSALNSKNKIGSAVRDLGCSIEELKIYLESKFKPGMSWDNWSMDGWHIDHIKPLASFDLTDRRQLLEACRYTNLQPLWAVDNFKKSDRIE